MIALLVWWILITCHVLITQDLLLTYQFLIGIEVSRNRSPCSIEGGQVVVDIVDFGTIESMTHCLMDNCPLYNWGIR